MSDGGIAEFGSSMLISPSVATPAVECRATLPDQEVGGSARDGALAFAAWQLGAADAWREHRLTPDQAMTYSAVFGCVRTIVNSFVSVGWHTYQCGADGRSKLPLDDDVSWLLGLQANPEMDALSWRSVLLKDALLTGNGYGEIERLGSGKPWGLWRIDPSRVAPVRDEDGVLWYEVGNGVGRAATYLRPEDVFHVRGLSPDGVTGWSVVELARKTIRLGQQTEQFGSDFFGKGPMPGGMVTVPRNLNETQRREFRRSFEELYSGARNHHRIVVLSDGVTFTPASMPNDDAQFLESRRFQVTEVCRWFGVPPHKLADLERATFSNVEEQEIAYVRDCVLPWARRLECEADLKLYGRTNRGRKFTKFNLDGLLRGNSTTQTDTVTKKVNAGLMTPNEGREYLDMNPTEGGDVLIVQGAMTTLERIIEGEPIEPTPTPTPPMPQQDDDQGDDQQATMPPMEDVRRVFGSLLTDVYQRLYRVDADKARRAANKGKLVEHVAEWYGETAINRVEAALLPVLEATAFAVGIGSTNAPLLVSLDASRRHVERCRCDLLEHGVGALPGWESRAAEVAADELGRLIP